MAVSSPIFMVFNRQTGALVAGFNGSVAAIPLLGQGNVRDLKIQFVDPSGSIGLNGQNPWTVANMAAYSLAAYVSAQPLGVGGPAPVASNLGLAYDATNNWFTGTLDLTPAGVTTLIGANPSVPAFLEFDVSYSGNTVLTVLQSITIFAVENKTGSSNPVPAASYPTTNQANATYVPFVGAPGVGFILTSPAGKQIYIVAKDDQTLGSQAAN